MAPETLRVGVIGAGNNTKSKHIPRLRMQKDVEIVAVVNRTMDSSLRAVKELGIPKACRDWSEIIADKNVDAVCIGTWPHMHADMTIAALDAGKHVLCEARMAMNAREAHAMLQASRRNPSRTAQIVPAPMTLPVDRTIAEMIASGAIGNLIAINVTASNGHYPEPDAPLHWRHVREFTGNNVMALGIWYEQMARWVGHASSAFAVGQVIVKHRRDGSGARVPIGVPDHIDVVGKMEQGGQYRLTVSAVLGHTSNEAEVWIHGNLGTLSFIMPHTKDPYLQLGKKDGPMGLLPIDPSKRDSWRVEEEFVNAVRGREEVKLTDFVTAARYMEWTDAVALSMRERREVHLPLL